LSVLARIFCSVLDTSGTGAASTVNVTAKSAENWREDLIFAMERVMTGAKEALSKMKWTKCKAKGPRIMSEADSKEGFKLQHEIPSQTNAMLGDDC
jgi:hypothetical protein